MINSYAQLLQLLLSQIGAALPSVLLAEAQIAVAPIIP